MAFLADALSRVKPSATIAVTQKARELKAQGRDIIGLSVRRARLRHAREHQAGGHRRDPPRRDEVHRRSPASRRCARRSPRSSSARTASTTRPAQTIVGTGGKQILFNALHGDAEPRRRGHHPRALLGQLSRHGAAVRRHAGLRADDAGERLQAAGRRARARDHAADQVADPQLAVEPVRRGLYARRAEGADRRADAPPACLGADRRHVRAPGLWRLRVHHAGAGRAEPL